MLAVPLIRFFVNDRASNWARVATDVRAGNLGEVDQEFQARHGYDKDRIADALEQLAQELEANGTGG